MVAQRGPTCGAKHGSVEAMGREISRPNCASNAGHKRMNAVARGRCDGQAGVKRLGMYRCAGRVRGERGRVRADLVRRRWCGVGGIGKDKKLVSPGTRRARKATSWRPARGAGSA